MNDKIKAFSFGGEDDPEEQNLPPEEALEEKLDDEPEDEPEDRAEPPQVEYTEPFIPTPAVDLSVLNKFDQAVRQDPALAEISALSHERFRRSLERTEQASRVSRVWLNGLSQRHFFVALGYPGFHLAKLLEGFAGLPQIRIWVNGLESIPAVYRHMLMLEHLLDRRIMATRSKMPDRQTIDRALKALRPDDDVSELLGGFEGLTARERAATTTGQLREGDMEGIKEILKIKPGGDAPLVTRRGMSLPMSRRGQGKGRPLGKRLVKPDSYCYNISRKSCDSTNTPTITPQMAMEYINQIADLERQYNCLYSLRRKDQRIGWRPDNIEMLPTSVLEEQRNAALRHAREEDS